MQYSVSAAVDPPLFVPIYASRAVNWSNSRGSNDVDDSRKVSQCGRRERQGGVGSTRRVFFLADRDDVVLAEASGLVVLVLLSLFSDINAHNIDTPSLKLVGAIRGGKVIMDDDESNVGAIIWVGVSVVVVFV